MKAVILFSGGLDSTVLLALARSQNRECTALSFDYGQRHLAELKAASRIAARYCVQHALIQIDPSIFKACALTRQGAAISENRTPDEILTGGIPSTYIPARNTLFLSYALSHAESLDAKEIYFGANILDRNGYPDCRPAFIDAFQKLIEATSSSVRLVTPLIGMNKQEIIRLGISLKAPLDLSISCYNPRETGAPCRVCDACILREEGFRTCSKSSIG